MTEELFLSRLHARKGGHVVYVPLRARVSRVNQVRVGTARYRPQQYAWMLVHGEIPEGMAVTTGCGELWCCCVAHLALTNSIDLARIVTYLRPRKLTPEQVAKVRALPRYCAGSWGKMVDWAKEWGVSPHTLRTLRTPYSRGRVWR